MTPNPNPTEATTMPIPNELERSLTPGQRDDVARTARMLREMGASSATLSMIGVGPLIVWANGTISQDMFAER